jgi:hypothetical protein
MFVKSYAGRFWLVVGLKKGVLPISLWHSQTRQRIDMTYPASSGRVRGNRLMQGGHCSCGEHLMLPRAMWNERLLQGVA